MKKSVRSLIKFVYVCYCIAGVILACQTYQYHPIYGTGIGITFNNYWNTALFLVNLLFFIIATIKSAEYLRGNAKVWWVFLWSFLLHEVIGMGFIVPMICFIYLRFSKQHA